MSKHSEPYPGKASKEYPNGRDWHHVQTAGLSTAGKCSVYVDPIGAVVLEWPRAEISHTAPDEAGDYDGPTALDLRLTPDEAHVLVSRILVAMA
jgi:hypothetical protein